MSSRSEIEAKIRRQYPNMFTHPRLRPGEIWIGDQVFDFAMINTALMRHNGLSSARFEEKESGKMVPLDVNGVVQEFPGHSVFVKLDELITAMQKNPG